MKGLLSRVNHIYNLKFNGLSKSQPIQRMPRHSVWLFLMQFAGFRLLGNHRRSLTVFPVGINFFEMKNFLLDLSFLQLILGYWRHRVAEILAPQEFFVSHDFICCILTLEGDQGRGAISCSIAILASCDIVCIFCILYLLSLTILDGVRDKVTTLLPYSDSFIVILLLFCTVISSFTQQMSLQL